MSNVKEWKTTLIGLLLIVVAIVDMWHFHKLETAALGALGVSGILFLFAPDKILNVLIRKARNSNVIDK